MAGVLGASPETVVLVGEASFRELTRTNFGPELLLRVYQAAFSAAATAAEYDIDKMSLGIVATFRQRVEESGEEYLEAVLHDTMTGSPESQDSRRFRAGRNGGKAV